MAEDTIIVASTTDPEHAVIAAAGNCCAVQVSLFIWDHSGWVLSVLSGTEGIDHRFITFRIKLENRAAALLALTRAAALFRSAEYVAQLIDDDSAVWTSPIESASKTMENNF